MRRRTLIVMAVLLATLTAASTGCRRGAQAKTIKIGHIAPLTGDVKTFGESTKEGFLLALEEAGFKAGDFTIEYVLADDRNDATEAVNAASKLCTQDKVKAIVGSVASKCTIAASEICQANKVVLITPTSTAERVTVDSGKRKDFIFRSCFIDPFQGTVGGRFAINTLKAKTAAVLFDQANDYTVGLSNAFKAEFVRGGGQVVAWEAYSQTDTDFSAALTKIAGLKPDLLYLPDYYNKVSLIGQQARDKGITATFLGGDGWDSSDLDFATMEGGYFTNHYSPEDTRPEVQTWVTRYKAKHGKTPDALATLAYDATKLVLKAIENAKSDNPAKIRDALVALKAFPTVTGRITFDQNGNPVKAAVLLQIRGGAQKFVEAVAP